MKKILALLCLIGSINAQTEICVNSYRNSIQRDPQVASDAKGNVVAAWVSENQASAGSAKDIYLQKFDAALQKLGTETLVNKTTAGDQEKPALAMNKRGDFVIVWQSLSLSDSAYDIKARIFNSAKNQFSDEFRVNTYWKDSQCNPDVSIDENGNVIVVWDSWFQDGSDRGIYAQRLSIAGEKVGNEFRINSTTAYSQARPAVRFFADGGFVAIWESWRQDQSGAAGYGIYLQLFDSNGNKTGTESGVNTSTGDYQWFGDVETFANGSYAVVWCSWEQDGSDGGIYLQSFSRTGLKKGGETLVNRSTEQYQWLPKITAVSSSEAVISWSSWLQDGSREGIYSIVMDTAGTITGLEQRVNDYTENFQWEPDITSAGDGNIIEVWSTYGQFGEDYDIAIKKYQPVRREESIFPEKIGHSFGRTTSKIKVHVVDISKTTGDKYEVSFSNVKSDTAYMQVKNLTKGTAVLSNFKFRSTSNICNITPPFEGAAIEIQPEFQLSLDLSRSNFRNISGTNVKFTVNNPPAGTGTIAPIDVVMVFGKMDTLSNGSFAAPLDTAYSNSGVKEVVTPFKAWNLSDNKKLDIMVTELSSTKNQKWNPKESIYLLTPKTYNSTPNAVHVLLTNNFTSSNKVLPSVGDSMYIYTKKPLTAEDKYIFETIRSNITTEVEAFNVPSDFTLYQNYPNPFNPSTNIKFHLPVSADVELKIFDLLGREVACLLQGEMKEGLHEISFNAAGKNLSSGVYISRMKTAGRVLTNKMIMIK